MTTIDYRCDANASGAEEAIYTVSTNPPLVLCAHHARDHGPGLLAQGYTMAKLRGTPVDRVQDPSMVRAGPPREWR